MPQKRWLHEKISTDNESFRPFKAWLSFSLNLSVFKKTGLLFIVAVFVTSSLFGIFYSDSASAAPTTKTACEAQGGTWNPNASSISASPTCSGATFALGMSLEQQVQSFMYYRTLGTCLVDGGPNLKDGGWFDGGERITRAHAQSGEWFGQATAPGASYLKGVNGVKAKDDGNGVDCNQTSLVNNALRLWDSWPPDEALCAMGMRSANDAEFNAKRCTNAQGGNDEFKRGNDLTTNFKNAVKSRIYGGKEPEITANAAWRDAGKYLLYLTTLRNACAPTATVSTTKPSGTTDKDYAVRQTGNSGNITITYYTGINNRSQGDGATISAGSSLSRSTGYDNKTCGSLLAEINGDAGKENGLVDAYKKWLTSSEGAVIPTPPGGTTDCAANSSCPVGDEAETSCAIEGIGWLVCPAISFMATIADNAFKFLSDSFLSIDTSELSTTSATYRAWSTMRNIANVAFVIAFLFIIFSQLTGQGIANYGIKKMLPRLVIAAILVNVSYFICQIAVDLSNILGYSLNQVFTSIGGSLPANNDTNIAGNESGNWVGITAAVIGGVGIAWALGASVLIPLLLGAVIALVMVFIILILRQMLIILLIVVAPIAFVAFLLPNTEQWFTKWRKMFVALLLVFPTIGLLFGASSLASTILKEATYGEAGTGGTIGQIVAAAMVALPLFLIWPLLKSAISSTGSIGAKITGAGDRLNKNTKSKAANSGLVKNYAAKKADQRARISTGNYAGKNPISRLRSFGNSKLNNSGIFNTATAGYGAQQTLIGQGQQRKDASEAMSLFSGNDSLVQAWAESGGDYSKVPPLITAGMSTDQKNQLKTQFNLMRNAGHDRKPTSFLAAAQYMSESGKGSGAAVKAALDNASRSGASGVEVGGAGAAAIAAYRKSGRGDAMAELSTLTGSPTTMEKGWSQVGPSSVHRDALGYEKDPVTGQDRVDPTTGLKVKTRGQTSYENHLQSKSENTRQALAGLDAMEQRAREKAESAILTSAQLHQYNDTGATPTITTIRDAKDYFGVR